jgi:hypothetical protein
VRHPAGWAFGFRRPAVVLVQQLMEGRITAHEAAATVDAAIQSAIG